MNRYIKPYKIRDKDVINRIRSIKFNSDIELKNKCEKVNNRDINGLKENKKIPNYLKKSIKEDCKYKNTYNSDKINIIIYSKTKNNNIFIAKIKSIINMFKFISKKKEYNIEILLLNDKKVINKKYNYIINFNSGVNVFNKVFLFRKEEIIKVLIHELIHYTQQDIWLLGHKLDYLYKNINIKWIKNVGSSNQYPNEAYTECLALIYLAIWKYNFYNLKDDIIKFVEKEINKQIEFSYKQVAKICKVQGYTSYNDLFKKEFLQENRVLSYFIVKSHLLLNPKFLKTIL